MNDLMTIIQQRYSERETFDSDKQVTTADVKKILEASRWAPTSHNMQNFEIVVVDDESILKLLGNLSASPSPEFIRGKLRAAIDHRERAGTEKSRDTGNAVPSRLAGQDATRGGN